MWKCEAFHKNGLKKNYTLYFLLTWCLPTYFNVYESDAINFDHRFHTKGRLICNSETHVFLNINNKISSGSKSIENWLLAISIE